MWAVVGPGAYDSQPALGPVGAQPDDLPFTRPDSLGPSIGGRELRAHSLGHTRFQEPEQGWDLPPVGSPGFEISGDGIMVSATPDRTLDVSGPGVHTRNGDSIELRFRALRPGAGRLEFGFDADLHEYARVELDFVEATVSLATSDWTVPQPVASAPLPVSGHESHTVLIEKQEGSGNLVKNADVRVYFDGERVLVVDGLDLLPEMGVKVRVLGTEVLVEEFTHRGAPSGIPEYLHLGGWQMLNAESIETNLDSICRGMVQAAEAGIQLLVTPETSITGLFQRSPMTRDPAPIAEAEDRLRRFIRELKDAPYLVAGLPAWDSVPGHAVESTRYNVCRVYDPDGEIASSHAKVHSANGIEYDFWHGYRLNELDVYGVPTTLHLCHDLRYPEVWTLPVMFGARLVLHPSNSGHFEGTVDAFEAKAKGDSDTSHAFHLSVNGGGGSYIVGPQRHENLITVSPECRRDNDAFPMVGLVQEGLFHARIRVHDAFGYWPARSFRTSEAVAEAYLPLYRSLGGSRYAGSDALARAESMVGSG